MQENVKDVQRNKSSFLFSFFLRFLYMVQKNQKDRKETVSDSNLMVVMSSLSVLLLQNFTYSWSFMKL